MDIQSDYGTMLKMLAPEHWPRADDDPQRLVGHLLLLARRMSPKQLATSKRKPKTAQAKGYVDGFIARAHVSTARVLKLAAGKRCRKGWRSEAHEANLLADQLSVAEPPPVCPRLPSSVSRSARRHLGQESRSCSNRRLTPHRFERNPTYTSISAGVR